MTKNEPLQAEISNYLVSLCFYNNKKKLLKLDGEDLVDNRLYQVKKTTK